jgi:hypothetical protein
MYIWYDWEMEMSSRTVYICHIGSWDARKGVESRIAL